MKFKIIANEQTPEIAASSPLSVLLNEKRNMLIKFLSFARRQTNCCGLAANQVSLDGVRLMENFFAIKVGHFWDIVLYPEIISYEGVRSIKKEGCLTWLGKTLQNERYTIIQAEYYNLKGEKINREITGFEAQIFQHEYDHLKGVEEK